MYLAKRLTKLSLGQIGRQFDANSTTNVLFAIRATERDMVDDPALAATIKRLETRIKSSEKKPPGLPTALEFRSRKRPNPTS
jgi:hypothetical protein